MMFTPGTMLTSHLRLVRMLGEGGMGSVWIADHLSLRTQVAIKFMSAALAQRPGAVARFEREATSAAQIKSPHVVQIFDHGITHDGVPYMVMELLEGEDVRHRIERLGRLGYAETAKILAQAARALGKAHSLGIVHRDIKPDNIFLQEVEGDLFVKILDFGIAKQLESDTGSAQMTRTGAMLGTPYFMSPEQMLSAKHVDFRSDMWSLAVVAYNCLTGSVPFDGETMGALCIAIDRAQYTPVSTLQAGLPPSVDAWFARALCRDPAGRFASPKEMADAFAAAVDGTRPSALPMAHAAMPAPMMAAAQTSPSATANGGRTFSGAAVTGADASPKRGSALVIALALGLPILGGGGVLAWLKLARAPEPAGLAAGASAVAPASATPSATVATTTASAPSVEPSATAEPTASAAAPPPSTSARATRATQPATQPKPAGRPTSPPHPGLPSPSKDRGF